MKIFLTKRNIKKQHPRIIPFYSVERELFHKSVCNVHWLEIFALFRDNKKAGKVTNFVAPSLTLVLIISNESMPESLAQRLTALILTN